MRNFRLRFALVLQSDYFKVALSNGFRARLITVASS